MNKNTLLVSSLAINGALLAMVAFLWNQPAEKPAFGESAQTPGARALLTKAKSPSELPAGVQPNRAFDWQQVESTDYRQYIANLRAIGCPEETIRDMITAKVSKLFAERRRGLIGAPKRYEYWKMTSRLATGALSSEQIKKLQQLANEKRTILTQLLGVEPDQKWDPLTEIDAEAAPRLGMPSSEEMQKRAAALQEADARIKSALGEMRFADYQHSQKRSYSIALCLIRSKANSTRAELFTGWRCAFRLSRAPQTIGIAVAASQLLDRLSAEAYCDHHWHSAQRSAWPMCHEAAFGDVRL